MISIYLRYAGLNYKLGFDNLQKSAKSRVINFDEMQRTINFGLLLFHSYFIDIKK